MQHMAALIQYHTKHMATALMAAPAWSHISASAESVLAGGSFQSTFTGLAYICYICCSTGDCISLLATRVTEYHPSTLPDKCDMHREKLRRARRTFEFISIPLFPHPQNQCLHFSEMFLGFSLRVSPSETSW